MHNLALYRKYRPENFEQVIGQEQVVSALQADLENKKVSHAYLFVGSRGTGKTSVARIFARGLGVSPNDIYEIDAASNRKVEEMRALRENVLTLPFESKYKVYILDEVHMFTPESWNTFLKTLEEPPAHVIFILATTELRKVPDTILSRCQIFNFKKPTENILKKVVIDVAKKEGFEIEAGGVEIIALIGDGAFRNTLGVLQKVLNNTTSKKISKEEVEKITGVPKGILINETLELLVEGNTENIFGMIEKIKNENLDMEIFLKLFIYKLRLAIVLKYAPKIEKSFFEDLTEDELSFLKEFVKKDKKGIIRSASLAKFLEAYQNTSNSFIKELPLEIALVEILGENVL